MAGRRQRRQRQDSSDSDSDDPEALVVQDIAYLALQLRQALQRPADYANAAAELAAIVRQLYASRCSKATQALIMEDLALAIDCCDGRIQSRTALAALMEAVERCLPQTKRNALQRQYKKSGVQLRRRERRQGSAAGGGADSDGEDEEDAPVTFNQLPAELIGFVFRYLDPVTLARSACVSREWRAAAAEERLWQQHCACILSCRTPGVLRTLAAAGSNSGSTGAPAGSCRQQFAAAARQRPELLLPWRTNRVMVAGRLAWLAEGQQRPARCRHVSTSTVLTFLTAGGRRGGGKAGYGSSTTQDGSSDSGSSSEDGGDGGKGLGQRLKFWQL